MTTYPSAGDYTRALQNPAKVFSHPSLREAEFTPGLGGPFCTSGTSAVVFPARIDDKQQALRCYLRDDAATPERYAALDRFVTGSSLGQFIGTVTWYRKEVQVNGDRWPVLKMDWIDGQHLNDYAGYLAEEEDTVALSALAGRWLEMVNELQSAQFAHGDLQHGNVLVDTGRRLRLVDFDSVWLPNLRGQAPPTESGHSNFQPPGLTADGRWGLYMDTFAGLAVYLALTVLSKRPQLWEKFNSGDNILFERADFVPPHDTDVWRSIAALGDSEVDRIADKVKECCVPGWRPDQTLAQGIAPGTVHARRSRWWENGGQTVGETAALPPLPTRSYQSPIASQAGSAKPPAAPTTPASVPPPRPGAPRRPGQWWSNQPGQAASTPTVGWPPQPPPVTPAPPPPPPASTPLIRPTTRRTRPPSTRASRTPTPPPSRTPARQEPKTPARRRRRPVFVTVGLVFIVLGLVSWISLATHQDPGGGAADGIVLMLIGYGLTRVRRRR
ncbi:MAG: AarF/UbiB family protein [Streptosporangiaceae bacterium]